MRFVEWLSGLFGKTGEKNIPLTYTIIGDSSQEITAVAASLRELAFTVAVNMIANTVSKCEFKTYINHKEVKGSEYYRFNVEANANQNASEFISKWIYQLYRNNECLIIDHGGQLFVADSFNKKIFALYGYTFNQVEVDNFKFDKTFHMEDVLYFKLNNDDVKGLTNSINALYAKLLESAEKSYRKGKGSKGVLDIGTAGSGSDEYKERLAKLLDKDFATFFKAENAVLPLHEGWSYTDLGGKTQSETSRDIKAMIDDVFEITAKGMQIPAVLLKGEVAGLEDAENLYLSGCIDPLCAMLQKELNRKRYGQKAVLSGSFIKICTHTSKHIDLLNVATPIDKLISSGSFSVNDVRKLVGEEPIYEPWANEHWMTKNYTVAKELLDSMTAGGDNDG